MRLQPHARIGPYEIVRQVGAGGMAEVYQGHDPRLGRDVAIKVLSGEFASSADRLRRFEIEARAAAALSHPNILAIYDVGAEGDVPYLVSEFLEGQTLRDALKEGPLPVSRALDIARQISSGLTAAHARGITHRDLKPENVFLTADGRVKILDFGIAKWMPLSTGTVGPTLASGAATGIGMVVGTVGYMAPEQATGKVVDFRCDQFAFGIVLYEMLRGRRTFERPSVAEELAAIIRDEPPSLAEARPDLPMPLQWLLSRCLAKDPAGRYESTRDLHRELETLATHVLHTQVPTPLAVRESGLPVPGTSLVGRDAEVDRAKQIVLMESVGLVTFTGPGGTGKTRLALQVAHELKDAFGGGVFFVSLSGIADPHLVPEAVAQAFGVRPSPQRSPLDGIRAHLAHGVRTSPTLLLLDSFEHLIGAVPFVIDLLKIPAPLKILVTSREPLRLSEEHEVPVPPLPRPDPSRLAAVEALAQNPAVVLFAERARASKPDFMLTGENVRVIAEICNRLDGLPLAIELAAARIKTLPPAAMVARLGSRLQILTGGARDLPERQQTLRGAIAWSHDLLNEAEQRLFRRMSVFIGGCTFEAVEAVADARQDLGVDVFDGGESLVHKSLLQLSEQPDGDARLAMMETVREYGLERLAESGEEAATRKAHAAYYLVLVEEAAAAIEGADQPLWLDRLDRDRDNLRAAIDWLIRSKDADWGLRLGSALLRYWELRELFAEGRARLSALLAIPGAAAPSSARAKALFAAGVLAAVQRDYRAQRPFFDESLQIFRGLGDRRGAAVVSNALAVLCKQQGDLDQARRVFEETCELWRDLDDGPAHARALSNIANILKEQGDLDQALQRHEEALALFRRLGDEAGAAWSLRYLGDIAHDRHDSRLAELMYQQALAAFKAMDDAWGTGSLLIDLGCLALGSRETAKGLDLFRQAAEAFQQLGGYKRGLARVLEGFAHAAALTGNAARAIRLAGAAAALRKATGTPLTPTEQQRVVSGLEPAHAALSHVEQSRAWIEGWTMTLEQAIEYGMSAET